MGNKRNKSKSLKQKVKLYVLGEGLTEYYYFKNIKDILNFNIKLEKKYFKESFNLVSMEKQAKIYQESNNHVICVFDMDIAQVSGNKTKINNFIKNYKDSTYITICHSMPTIEFWFLLHFVNTDKFYQNKKEVITELKKHPSFENYQTSKIFLENKNWVDELSNRIDIAIDNANRILKTKQKEDKKSYTYFPHAIKIIKDFK